MSFFIREARVREISDVVVVALFRVKKIVAMTITCHSIFFFHFPKFILLREFFLSLFLPPFLSPLPLGRLISKGGDRRENSRMDNKKIGFFIQRRACTSLVVGWCVDTQRHAFTKQQQQQNDRYKMQALLLSASSSVGVVVNASSSSSARGRRPNRSPPLRNNTNNRRRGGRTVVNMLPRVGCRTCQEWTRRR